MVSQKKKMVVNSLVIVLFLGFVAFCVNLAKHPQGLNKRNQQDQWQRIQKERVITIGLDDTFVPMGFRDAQGKLVGFDIDLATKAFARYGIKVNWQPIDWSMKETELNTGNIDALWNGYTKTPSRAKKVAFSDVYHMATQTVVVKKSSGIRSFADMTGKRLGLQTASSGEQEFNDQPQVLKNYLNKKPVGYDTFDKAFTDLNANRIDGLLVDEDYARYYVAHQENPDDYAVLVGKFPPSADVVGFRKSDKDLRQAVNKALAALRQDGELQALENQWFGPKGKPETP
ncbi:amino acid ABC transporter substrate-binding protein [Leuconostocaceae bacterium ESL0958]|nr:amino acid ABC transporter substrate-binding protein [Leuconostocaceae bacterium ESL0958]